VTTGRPTIMTPETIDKLEYAFSLGCDDLTACFHANIGKSTLYNYQNAHPSFVERKEALKNSPLFLAKKVQYDALVEGDKTVAIKLIERREGIKKVIAGDAENPVHITSRNLTADLDPVEAAKIYRELINSTQAR